MYPDAMHLTVVLFSLGFPGITRQEFWALPDMATPRTVIEESGKRVPFTFHRIPTSLLSTEHLYMAICCIVTAWDGVNKNWTPI